MTQRIGRAAIVVAVLMSGLVAAATSAYAEDKVTKFAGTRQQVRNACASLGDAGLLEDHGGKTTCTNVSNGNEVTCDNNMQCTGHYAAHFTTPGAAPAASVRQIEQLLSTK